MNENPAENEFEIYIYIYIIKLSCWISESFDY